MQIEPTEIEEKNVFYQQKKHSKRADIYWFCACKYFKRTA
jgi:hypothetical protein